MKKTILLIGCGHMGSALLNSWYKKKELKISVVDPNRHKILKKKYNKKIIFYSDLQEVKKIDNYDIIIIAVKPQIVKNINQKLNKFKNKNFFILSIVAGKKISYFEKNLSKKIQIIRAMPNMPVSVQKGITCFISNKNLSNKNKLFASNLFKYLGKVLWLKKDSDIDKVTAISGSGPAYYFLFIEFLTIAAKRLGLEEKICEPLVYQTAVGSLELLLNNNKSASELRKSIAVRGGTTEAAIKVFQDKEKFKKIILEATKAAFIKSKKIGKN